MLVKSKQHSIIILKILGKSHVRLISKNSATIRTAKTFAPSMESVYVECVCAIQEGLQMIVQ